MMLIGPYDSPFTRRVAIALRHYELPFDHRPWSAWSDADKIAFYNPLLRVPVLVLDDGTALVESAAILDALDDLVEDLVDEDRLLLPRRGPVRREGLRIAALSTGLADKAVSLLYEHLVRPFDRRSPMWVLRCQSQIRNTLKVLESARARRSSPWWLGDRISHADIALGCTLRFLSEAHKELYVKGQYPSLAAHAARCEERPEFAQIVQPLRPQVGDN